MRNCSLLVSTCDSYSDLWKPFFTLLNKYWPTIDCPIYLITESKKVSFNGLNVHCPLDFHQKRNTWSERLLEVLEIIDTEYLILILDDFWLKEPVNVTLIERFVEYISEDLDIGFICLRKQPLNDSDVPSDKYSELIRYGKRNPYRINAQIGLWRKSYLHKILRKHETAWEFEWYGSKRSRIYRNKLYFIKPDSDSIFNYDSGGVVFRGKFIRSYIDYFKDLNIIIESNREVEDLNEMRKRYSNSKPNRMKLTYWSNLLKSLGPKC